MLSLFCNDLTEGLWLNDNKLEGTIPTDVGELMKLSEYCGDWHNDIHIVIPNYSICLVLQLL
jgi:hypothetical protein